MTRSTSAIAKMSKPLINPPTRDETCPHHSPSFTVQRKPWPFVCLLAVPGQPGHCWENSYASVLELARCTDRERGQVGNLLGENGRLNSACKSLIASLFATRKPLDANASNPALKLAQHELADDVDAGFGVVEARDRGKLLAAMVPENLGILLRDLFQRLQAVGGEAGRDHGQSFHALLRQLLDGLVGVRF